jgi:hypothetical protein
MSLEQAIDKMEMMKQDVVGRIEKVPQPYWGHVYAFIKLIDYDLSELRRYAENDSDSPPPLEDMMKIPDLLTREATIRYMALVKRIDEPENTCELVSEYFLLDMARKIGYLQFSPMVSIHSDPSKIAYLYPVCLTEKDASDPAIFFVSTKICKDLLLLPVMAHELGVMAHELGHMLRHERAQDEREQINELFCDLFGAVICGLAYLNSVLNIVDAEDIFMIKTKHPPWEVRVDQIIVLLKKILSESTEEDVEELEHILKKLEQHWNDMRDRSSKPIGYEGGLYEISMNRVIEKAQNILQKETHEKNIDKSKFMVNAHNDGGPLELVYKEFLLRIDNGVGAASDIKPKILEWGRRLRGG